MHKCKVIKGGEPAAYGMPSLGEKEKARKRPLSPRQKAEALEREAYEKGYAAGEEAGRQMAEEKASVLLGRLEATIGEFMALRAKTLRELEPQVVRLAVSIARKVIGQELSAKPELLVKTVKEAMMRIERTGKVTVRLNPSLYELFTGLKPELMEIHPDVVFEVDPSVPSSGPLVVGPEEEVLTDIESQIDTIAEEAGLAGR